MSNRDNEVLKSWINSLEGRKILKILRDRYYDVPSYDTEVLEMAKIGGQRDLIEDLLILQEEEEHGR